MQWSLVVKDLDQWSAPRKCPVNIVILAVAPVYNCPVP